jgi:hypothetical protein
MDRDSPLVVLITPLSSGLLRDKVSSSILIMTRFKPFASIQSFRPLHLALALTSVSGCQMVKVLTRPRLAQSAAFVTGLQTVRSSPLASSMEPSSSKIRLVLNFSQFIKVQPQFGHLPSAHRNLKLQIIYLWRDLGIKSSLFILSKVASKLNLSVMKKILASTHVQSLSSQKVITWLCQEVTKRSLSGTEKVSFSAQLEKWMTGSGQPQLTQPTRQSLLVVITDNFNFITLT